MKNKGRLLRHKRIAKKIRGDELSPRLVVFRSKKHIYVQLINDAVGKVVISVSTLGKDFKDKKIKSTNKEAAKQVGKIIAEKALKLGVKNVCFDRAGFKYHGRVKELAEGVREGGLRF